MRQVDDRGCGVKSFGLKPGMHANAREFNFSAFAFIRVHSRPAFLACALAASALAAVDGTVVNRTTGKPQAGAAVSLIEIGQAGMTPLADAQSDALGRFRFDASPKGAVLIQTTYQGVSYNAAIQPGAPATGVEVEIFEASKTPGAVEITQHVYLFEPSEKELNVSESFFYSNKGKTTYHDPSSGTARVLVPGAAGETIQVTVTGPNNLPLQRSAEKAGRPNLYKVDFPIKPGESRIDVNYKLPFANPGKFSGKLLQKETLTRLVVPAGVELKGDGLEAVGREPRSQAQIFNVKSGPFEVEIQGTGSIRSAEAAPEDEDSGPGIQQILPRLYDRIYIVLGIALAILALGFALLYRRSASEPPAAAGEKPALRGKRRK